MRLLLLVKVALGFLFLALAAIGLLLPIWPTTPFVLLSVGCFSSTPKLKKQLMRIPFFREYYESYTAGHGLRRKTVLCSLIFLWGMLLVSSLVMWKLWVMLLMIPIGLVVTVHILWIAKGRVKLDKGEETQV